MRPRLQDEAAAIRSRLGFLIERIEPGQSPGAIELLEEVIALDRQRERFGQEGACLPRLATERVDQPGDAAGRHSRRPRRVLRLEYGFRDLECLVPLPGLAQDV